MRVQIVIGLFLVAVAAGAWPNPAWAEPDWFVDVNVPALPEDQDGLSWGTAFSSLQKGGQAYFQRCRSWKEGQIPFLKGSCDRQ